MFLGAQVARWFHSEGAKLQTYSRALVSIWDAPRPARWAVEEAIAVCLPSEPPLSELVHAGHDLWASAGATPGLQAVSNPAWDVAFFTWEVTQRNPVRLACVEILAAPKDELHALEATLARLSVQHGFACSFTPLEASADQTADAAELRSLEAHAATAPAMHSAPVIEESQAHQR